MDLKTYISDMAVRRQLARACGTKPEYLWQISKEWRGRKPSVELAKKIEDATDGIVTRHDLRPDVFGVAPGSMAVA